MLVFVGVMSCMGVLPSTPDQHFINDSIKIDSAMNNEVWKCVRGYEGFYEVSNTGRIRSIDRRVNSSHGATRIVKGRIMSPNKDGDGYYKLDLCKFGIVRTFKVHKLVAMSFVYQGDLSNGFVVDHIDNNRENNNCNNLQVITIRENSSKDKNGCSSKYVGVFYLRNRNVYTAAIAINGKQKHIGTFNREYDAHLAYQNELRKLIDKKSHEVI